MIAADLPALWHRRDRFVLLEAGFGNGESFLSAWRAWRADPDRCRHLEFIAIEPRPPAREALASGAGHPDSAPLVDQLQRDWPSLTANLHSLSFENGGVRLLLAVGDLSHWLRELDARVDCLSLEAAPASELHDAHLAKRLARVSAAGATLTLPLGDARLPDRLTSAGFAVQTPPQVEARPASLSARYAPRFTARGATRHAPADIDVRPNPAAADAAPLRHAVIVGGGLAGCAAAWALAERGWTSTVIDRAARIAAQASGNRAGLFHGTLNEPDGLHARFNRAAAGAAQRAVRTAIDHHGVSGATDGLLRLERTLAVDDMRALVQRLQLPPDYVRALDSAQASAVAGVAVAWPAWFFAGGGWVQPAGLARSYLERAGSAVAVRLGAEVQRLQAAGDGWRLLDSAGRTLAEATTVVLANAGDAPRLLGGPGWPLESVRGQLSELRTADTPFDWPRVPISGAGYLLPAIDGLAMFGATADPGDVDAEVREADHIANLAQLERLLGHAVAVDLRSLQGRTAWRCTSADRLPLIGAVPNAELARSAARLDQPRLVPRTRGLFVFTALGSRGITWSALGAQMLAASITGSAAPLERSLIDAVDPARFITRRARRGAH